MLLSAKTTNFRDFLTVLDDMSVELGDGLLFVAVFALDLEGLQKGIEGVGALDLLELG